RRTPQPSGDAVSGRGTGAGPHLVRGSGGAGAAGNNLPPTDFSTPPCHIASGSGRQFLMGIARFPTVWSILRAEFALLVRQTRGGTFGFTNNKWKHNHVHPRAAPPTGPDQNPRGSTSPLSTPEPGGPGRPHRPEQPLRRAVRADGR